MSCPRLTRNKGGQGKKQNTSMSNNSQRNNMSSGESTSFLNDKQSVICASGGTVLKDCRRKVNGTSRSSSNYEKSFCLTCYLNAVMRVRSEIAMKLRNVAGISIEMTKLRRPPLNTLNIMQFVVFATAVKYCLSNKSHRNGLLVIWTDTQLIF